MSRFEAPHCDAVSHAVLRAGHPAPRRELGPVFYNDGRVSIACRKCGAAVAAKPARYDRRGFDALNRAIERDAA